MTSPALVAAALQLGAYRTQVRPQGTGTPGAGDFEAAVQPAQGKGVGGRAVVQQTEAVRVELSAAARNALLQLQTLNQPANTSKPRSTSAAGGRERAADAWSGKPYVAPGATLNLSV